MDTGLIDWELSKTITNTDHYQLQKRILDHNKLKPGQYPNTLNLNTGSKGQKLILIKF